jgi:hypothetical protein
MLFSSSENQFMILIFENLTSVYELQLAMMERRIKDIERPLTVEEISGELSLRFERLSISKAEGEVLEEHALFGEQFKGKCLSKLWTARSQVVPMQKSRNQQWWK